MDSILDIENALVGNKVVTGPDEFQITVEQQEVVDELGTEFLNTGDSYYERGYMLGHIPHELRASWGRSCLQSASSSSGQLVGALPLGTAQSSASSHDVAVLNQRMTAVANGSVNDLPMLASPVSPVVNRSRGRSITVAASPTRTNSSRTAVATSRMTAAKSMSTSAKSSSYHGWSQSSNRYPWNQ